MQGTWVQSLVQEDPTLPLSNRASVSQLLSLRSRASELKLLKPTHLEPVLCNETCEPQLEKALSQQWRPNAANKQQQQKQSAQIPECLELDLFTAL